MNLQLPPLNHLSLVTLSRLRLFCSDLSFATVHPAEDLLKEREEEDKTGVTFLGIVWVVKS